MFGFKLGASTSSTKDHSWIDPKTSAAQWGNYGDVQGIQPYNPTSAGLIGQYYNPYEQQVVDQTQQDIEHQRQMAVNNVGDQANAAHAFGGSRHGVAEGITNGEFGRIGGLLTAQLRNQGYGQALQTAQGENQFGYSGLLSKYGLQNQALGQITPETFGKRRTTGFSGEVSGSYGK